jgi:hypothetical protein
VRRRDSVLADGATEELLGGQLGVPLGQSLQIFTVPGKLITKSLQGRLAMDRLVTYGMRQPDELVLLRHEFLCRFDLVDSEDYVRSSRHACSTGAAAGCSIRRRHA